ncbi:hypothetical protein MKW98_009864 [Papaver atlanticum]|uniref:Uncharacterized protein n=1 Tax=Papaver atlanticum TaxID=357466 RepID=A0AAD4TA32_9MAGN|nr:hypothetical protein MKW98_009864 [Papaver atlanticum]
MELWRELGDCMEHLNGARGTKIQLMNSWYRFITRYMVLVLMIILTLQEIWSNLAKTGRIASQYPELYSIFTRYAILICCFNEFQKTELNDFDLVMASNSFRFVAKGNFVAVGTMDPGTLLLKFGISTWASRFLRFLGMVPGTFHQRSTLNQKCSN